MSPLEELNYNEQYTQWNKYNSIHTLPSNVIFQKNLKKGYWLLLAGFILLTIDVVLANFVFDPTSTLITLCHCLVFIVFVAAIYTIMQKQKIELDLNTISIKNDVIEWSNIERILKHSFEAFGGLTFKNIIIETKDNRKIEFTYNFFNYESSDVEQLIYMFYKRSTKTNADSK